MNIAPRNGRGSAHWASLKTRSQAIVAAVLGAIIFQICPSGLAAKEPGEPTTVEILPFARGNSDPLINAGPSGAAGRPGVAASGSDDWVAIAQSALPGLLTLSLIPYQHVRVAAQPGRISLHGFSPLDQTNIARSPVVHVDFFVRGFITLRDEKVSINATIGNRTTGKSKTLKSVVVHVDRLFYGAQELAFAIANEIAHETGATFKPRSIALACIREDKAAEAIDLEPVIWRGIVAVLHNLILASRDRRIRWAFAQNEGCLSATDLRDLAKRQQADAVIAFSPKFLKEQRTVYNGAVKSTVHIPGEDRRIPIPDIALTSGTLIVNDEELTRQLVTLFTVILAPTGAWTTSDIPATDETASKYLEIGKRISATQDEASNRTMALEDYFYSMALSRPKELSKSQTSDAEFQLARIRLKQGRLDDAAALLESTARNAPNFEVLLMRADLSFQRGQYGESKDQFRQVIRSFPNRREAYERLATLLALRNDEDEAAQVYRDLIRIAPAASMTAYRGLAKLSLAKGDWLAQETWQEAASFLDAGIRNLSDASQQLDLQQALSDLYADAGRAFSVNRNDQTALLFLDKSISVIPSVKAHFYRAGLHYTRNLDDALADYSAAVALAESAPTMTPEYIGSKLAILEILTLQGKYDAAISYADHTARIFAASLETLSFEPVVRLIGLAAKIAGNRPDFRLDIEDLRTISSNSSRDYVFGSYIWRFDAIDDFVKTNPRIPESFKCLFEQASLLVQVKASQAASQLDRCPRVHEQSERGR